MGSRLVGSQTGLVTAWQHASTCLFISLSFTEGFFNPTAVGGLGLGNCPRSCLTACRAANFASTTSCTYTYISRPILGTSTSVTKSCTQCYPIIGPILGGR